MMTAYSIARGYSLTPAVIETLLSDRTTGEHIRWASGDNKLMPIKSSDLGSICPRYAKRMAERKSRTRTKAEVFTPLWVVNQMVNKTDEVWFGRADVFNRVDGQMWKSTIGKIQMPAGKTCLDYIKSTRLEITCGEAPYIVTPYEPADGSPVLLHERVGMLDRKLRIVGENATSTADWIAGATMALKSVYGYEYQGDSLLLARLNVMRTMCDYHMSVMTTMPDDVQQLMWATVIACNIWQMDGLTDRVPVPVMGQSPYCQITDWESGNDVIFHDIKDGAK